MPEALMGPDVMWYWFTAALIAAAIELLLRQMPTGFGLTCLLFGILSNFPAIYERLSLDLFLLTAGVLMIAGNYVLKKHLSAGAPSRGTVSTLQPNRAARVIGMAGVVSEEIKNGYGRARVDGTLWRCQGPDARPGQRVIVTAVHLNTLAVTLAE